MRSMLLAVLMAAPLMASADSLGAITILEGQALLYRGTGRLHAAEGVRLVPGDIVETAPATFVQLELADQSVAQFGPATRVMFSGSGPRQKPERWMHVLDGWVKLIRAKQEAAPTPGFELRSPFFDIPPSPSVVVLHATSGGAELFLESGGVRLAERQRAGSETAALTLKAGDYYQRKFPARGTVTAAASPPFAADMPRSFRDSLPLRIDRFRERAVPPKDAPAFAYADVAPWLQSEPAIRRPLMQRWRSKAQEPAFRAALVSNLSAHPEWDPILFPEKYRPKDPPTPKSTAAASPASR